MEENEVVELELQLDSADVEKTLERLLESADAFGELMKVLGIEMSKLFGTLQRNLEKMVGNVERMTDAFEKATAAIEKLMQSFSVEEMSRGLATVGDQIWGLFDEIMSVVASAFTELFAMEWGPVLLTGMDMVAKGLISIVDEMLACNSGVAALAVGIALMLATIVAVVANWDKISSAVQTFTAETLPRAWGQLTQWFQNISAGVTSVLDEALSVTAGLFSVCWNQITSLWNGLVSWLKSALVQPLTEIVSGIFAWFKQLLGSIQQTISDTVNNLIVIISGSWEIIKAVWNIAVLWVREHVVAPLGNLFGSMWDGFVSGAKAAWESVKTVFSHVAEFFVSTFRAAWQGIVKVFCVAGEIFDDIKDGVFEAFKLIVNSLIKGINAVVKIPFDAINSALQTVRNIRILDITPFSGLRPISVPQIPYLAKGAVLPANQPFLAMVGDQKHGTNVEAPLSTIQEAVAVVLDEQLSALMAGFNATVQEIRNLRADVGNIRIGDEVIFRAAERYREKRAVMHGTGW